MSTDQLLHTNTCDICNIALCRLYDQGDPHPGAAKLEGRTAFKTPLDRHAMPEQQTGATQSLGSPSKPHANRSCQALMHLPRRLHSWTRANKQRLPLSRLKRAGRHMAKQEATTCNLHFTPPHRLLAGASPRFHSEKGGALLPPRKGEARGRRRTSLRSDMGWAVHLH